MVYRLHETSIVVAVDEAPDDGLEQPLRLEKLANKVHSIIQYSRTCHC